MTTVNKLMLVINVLVGVILGMIFVVIALVINVLDPDVNLVLFISGFLLTFFSAEFFSSQSPFKWSRSSCILAHFIITALGFALALVASFIGISILQMFVSK